MTRKDDFEKRRKHLENLTDEQLKTKFWNLANQAVDPLISLAKENTSPAIERSVLLRMGFSSIEAKAIVDRVIDYGLIGKGAGHVVYKIAEMKKISIREAGLNLLEGNYWDEVLSSFEVVK